MQHKKNFRISSYGKCMGFTNNYPQHGKMQQNPSYEESLGNSTHIFACYGYFSSSARLRLPIKTSKHFPATFYNLNEQIIYCHRFISFWRESLSTWPQHIMDNLKHRKKLPTLITQEIHGFPTNFPQRKKMQQWGDCWKLVLLLFLQYVCLFPKRVPSYGILHYMGHPRLFLSVPHIMERCSKTQPVRETLDKDTHVFPKVWLLFFEHIPTLWYSISRQKCMSFLINFNNMDK